MKHLELKTELIERYTRHYELCDPAHRIDHVIKVCDHALKLEQQLGLNLDLSIVVGAAITHDIFTWSRSNHHEMVEHWLLTANEPWLREFDADSRWLMAKAAGQHRASYKGEYSSIYSELISAADRGEPGDLRSLILRCYQFGRHNLKESHEDALARIKPHLLDKYVNKANTYGKVYSPLYLQAYGALLETQKEQIINLDKDSEYFQGLELLY